MTTDEVWHFGANDNTRGGWLVFLLYLILAALCWREVVRHRVTITGHALSRQFWIGLSVFVTALGVNKQLDLQTLLIALGRSVASAEGIIEYKRWINWGFVLVSGFFGVLTAACLLKLSRRVSTAERMVLIGVAALAGFVLFRTASINHVDLLGATLDRHRPLIAIELAVLAFLGFAVFRREDPRL